MRSTGSCKANQRCLLFDAMIKEVMCNTKGGTTLRYGDRRLFPRNVQLSKTALVMEQAGSVNQDRTGQRSGQDTVQGNVL